MARRKKQNKEIVHTLINISSNTNKTNKILQDIKEEGEQTNDQVQNIIYSQNEIIKILKSPVTIILSVVAIAVTVWGTLYSVHNSNDNSASTPAPDNPEIAEQTYELYLYSEYSKITIYGETNITATLNFDTDYVTVTAHLASGKTDTLSMNRKNSEEWELKVIFNEPGTHEIVAETKTPDGDILNKSIKVEVIPMNINLDQLFNFTY